MKWYINLSGIVSAIVIWPFILLSKYLSQKRARTIKFYSFIYHLYHCIRVSVGVTNKQIITILIKICKVIKTNHHPRRALSHNQTSWIRPEKKPSHKAELLGAALDMPITAHTTALRTSCSFWVLLVFKGSPM